MQMISAQPIIVEKKTYGILVRLIRGKYGSSKWCDIFHT